MAAPRRKRKVRSTPEEQWAHIFSEWRRSGLSAEDFCKKHNYSAYGFNHYYEKQFGKKPEFTGDVERSEAQPLFVPIGVLKPLDSSERRESDVEPAGKIEISTSIGGRTFAIRIQPGFDSTALRQVIDVLGGIQC